MSIICAHAPTEGKADEEKGKCDEELQIIYNKIAKHDIAIKIRDLNAKIVREGV